jgi:phosphatidylserine/phosphatidylglycerophosphate/cardiolipin synthase-like enzyme
LTVTAPTGPSTLGAAIRREHPEMVETADVLRHVALQARERLVFVVPFFDRHGAEMLAELFGQTRARERVLVCRSVEDIREAGAGLDAKLAAMGVRVAAYRIAHYAANGSCTVETFHAKIALADSTCAYVGSANAMRSSLETTMECGFMVRGAAAIQVRELVDLLLVHAS